MESLEKDNELHKKQIGNIADVIKKNSHTHSNIITNNSKSVKSETEKSFLEKYNDDKKIREKENQEACNIETQQYNIELSEYNTCLIERQQKELEEQQAYQNCLSS